MNAIGIIILFIAGIFAGVGFEREYHKDELDRRMHAIGKMEYNKRTGKLILIENNDTLLPFTKYDYRYLRTGSMKVESEK